jgi:hypothetical protein
MAGWAGGAGPVRVRGEEGKREEGRRSAGPGAALAGGLVAH